MPDRKSLLVDPHPRYQYINELRRLLEARTDSDAAGDVESNPKEFSVNDPAGRLRAYNASHVC